MKTRSPRSSSARPRRRRWRPTATGQQLRLRTYNEGAAGLLLAGGITLTVAVVAGLAALMGETDLAARLPGFATLFAVGLGLTGSAVLRLPGWARRRQSQMEGIAERAVLMAASDSVEPTSEED